MQRELYHAARAKPHAAPYYTFMLPSFAVPAEREALLVAAAQAPTAWWAIKPSRGTGGRGIRLARGAEELGTLGAEGSVVERFLSRPLLFEGRRFHIRLFIVVTAWRPLRAYVDGASARIFLARLPNTMFDPALPQVSWPWMKRNDCDKVRRSRCVRFTINCQIQAKERALLPYFSCTSFFLAI
jgi:hypothetical protein